MAITQSLSPLKAAPNSAISAIRETFVIGLVTKSLINRSD